MVYLVDQPARGRSAGHSSVNGPISSQPAHEATEMVATKVYGTWPQAKKHTQWPGQSEHNDDMGDPIFDQWYASLVEQLQSIVEIQTNIRQAGTALLDKIGPAILVTQ